jgi:hypothetical protein
MAMVNGGVLVEITVLLVAVNSVDLCQKQKGSV